MQEGYMSSSVAMNTYHTYYNDNDDMAVDNGDTQGQCEDVLMQCLHGGGGGGVDGGDELEVCGVYWVGCVVMFLVLVGYVLHPQHICSYLLDY